MVGDRMQIGWKWWQSKGKRVRRPALEGLEQRQMLAASLAPLADVTVPENLGRPVALDGGNQSSQIFTVTSDNPNVRANIAQGPFLTIDVTHASSGPNDPAFSGSMTFQLFEDLTPTAVSRISSLVNQGFYLSPTTGGTLPSKNFHRVAPGFPGPEFIVQGGSVNGDGTGDVNEPGFPFDDEFVASLVFSGTGQLAMANAGDDTNSSQFFVTTGSPRFLDFNHTIFGQIVDGFETVELMTQVARGANDAPISPILFTGTTLTQGNPNGVVLIDTTSASAGQSANITVTATDPSDATTVTETFQAVVVPNLENSRPFLGPIGNQVVGVNQVAEFQLTAVSTDPGDVLTFLVEGGLTANRQAFVPVENASATVDAQGNVTVTPDPGFEGDISLIVGVRDQIDRSGNINAVTNFDTQQITLTVTQNTPPTAEPVVANTLQNEPVSIQLVGDPNDPGQTLTFELTSLPASGSITQFDVNTGVLVYTPTTNFVGADQFTYRVRDVGPPTPNTFSTIETVTINVAPGQPVNVRPTAFPINASVEANTSTVVQLFGETGNPESAQTLTFQLDTTGIRGTVTDFDPVRGTFVYTPPLNFLGEDQFAFTVQDVGEPLPNLTSEPAPIAITVFGAMATGAVRQIGPALIVTPPPQPLRNSEPNTIIVSLVDQRVTVSINGVIDTLRPQVGDLERLIIYGSVASDIITVSPEVPLLATINGGLGGRNQLQAGGAPTRIHGWFGFNRMTGGPFRDELIGRMGRVQFRPSPGDDLLFAGEPNRFPQFRSGQDQGIPPAGTFFRFVNGRIVALPTPPPRLQGLVIPRPTPLRTEQPVQFFG